MHIFITGATGFVGSAIVADLLKAGHQVSGLARSDAAILSLVKLGAQAHRGDLNDLDSLRSGAGAADAVIHAAFDHDFSRMAQNCELDRQAIAAMGDALAGSNKQFIVTSGLPATPGRIATEHDAPPAGAHGIGRVSEPTALSLIEHGVRASVIRMPQVHDQLKQGFASYLMVHARAKGLSAYVGDGRNRWPAVHRLDCARLYGVVLEKGIAGACYHAVAQQHICMRDIAEAIGQRLGVPVVSLTEEESASHFGWLDRVAKMDVPASSALTQQWLDWHPLQQAGLIDSIVAALPG